MSATPVRCEHDGIKWFPRSTLEKYSPDQTAWADRKLAEEKTWHRWPFIEKFGVHLPQRRPWGSSDRNFLHGDWLRQVFREPEDGYAYTEGNILVTTGLQNLGWLLMGTAASGTNGRPIGNPVSNGTVGPSFVGVGASSTSPVQADVHLGADAGSAWYQIMDSAYPTLSGSGVAGGGQLNGQMTAASGNANFVWQEWCWGTCVSGTLTATATMASVGTSPAMLNHWEGTSLGTKGAGATWVFSTTITFS